MSQFTTPCRVEVIGKNLFRLIEPFEYHVGCYPSEEIIRVPNGFVTNFASIPRLIWPIISPIDSHGKAAVLHDWLYDTGEYPRLRCEEIFKEAMEVLNVPEWQIFCIYNSVYLLGWYRWNQLRRRNCYDNH